MAYDMQRGERVKHFPELFVFTSIPPALVVGFTSRSQNAKVSRLEHF